MRKKIIPYFLPLVLLTASTKAQDTDSAYTVVRYKFVHIDDTTQPDRPLMINMALFIGAKYGMYGNYDRVAPRTTGDNITVNGGTISGGTFRGTLSASSSPTITSAGSFQMPAGMRQVGNIIRDLANAKQSVFSFAGGKVFSVDEKIPELNWTITEETKTIGGMQCQKATTHFKGRDYEAWFCSQLPYSYGPWKLGGLPGLILDAYDTRKEVQFSFVSFESKVEKPFAIDMPKDMPHATAKEFKQYQEALERDRNANMGSAGGGIVVRDVAVAGRLTGPDGNPVKPKKLNNPIEREEK